MKPSLARYRCRPRASPGERPVPLPRAKVSTSVSVYRHATQDLATNTVDAQVTVVQVGDQSGDQQGHADNLQGTLSFHGVFHPQPTKRTSARSDRRAAGRAARTSERSKPVLALPSPRAGQGQPPSSAPSAGGHSRASRLLRVTLESGGGGPPCCWIRLVGGPMSKRSTPVGWTYGGPTCLAPGPGGFLSACWRGAGTSLRPSVALGPRGSPWRPGRWCPTAAVSSCSWFLAPFVVETAATREPLALLRGTTAGPEDSDRPPFKHLEVRPERGRSNLPALARQILSKGQRRRERRPWSPPAARRTRAARLRSLLLELLLRGAVARLERLPDLLAQLDVGGKTGGRRGTPGLAALRAQPLFATTGAPRLVTMSPRRGRAPHRTRCPLAGSSRSGSSPG
jgi:hypothetical protein